MDGSQPRQGLPKRPDETTSYFEDWRSWAWKVGQYASAYAKDGPGGCEKYVRFWVSKMRHFTDEQKASLVESYQTAYKRCRKPPNAPEQINECIKWLESKSGIIRLTEKIGRSQSYPRLFMLAYCLGRDGKPFPFAANRIASLCNTDPRTVANFLGVIEQLGLLIVVSEGTSGVNGRPSWYRISNPQRWRDILAMERRDREVFEYFLLETCPYLMTDEEKSEQNHL